MLIERADALGAAGHAASAPKGYYYNAWREETRAWMHLCGPRIEYLMAKICSVDLSPRTFGVGQVVQTRVGNVEATLWRDTQNRPPGFPVFSEIAATAFLAEVITTAITEFSEAALK